MKPLVILPAYNEEENIGKAIQDLKKEASSFEILVVDDGSRDRTAEVAKQLGVKVLKLSRNNGKGYACGYLL